MIGVKDQYFLIVTIDGDSDFLIEEDLILFKIQEETGNVLPRFELIFLTSDPNLITKLNEGNTVSIVMGRSVDDSERIEAEMQIVFPDQNKQNGEKQRVHLLGVYKNLAYTNNPSTQITDKMTGMEVVQKYASENWEVDIDPQKSDDTPMPWTKQFTTNKIMVDKALSHLMLNNGVPIQGISSKGVFIVRNIEDLKSADPVWNFTRHPQKDNDVFYDGNPETINEGTYNNAVNNYGRSVRVFDTIKGTSKLIEYKGKPQLSQTGTLPRTKDILMIPGTTQFRTDTVHEDYELAELKNSTELSSLSSVRTAITVPGVFFPIRVVDPVTLSDTGAGAEKEQTNILTSGTRIVTKVCRTIANRQFSTYIEMVSESVNNPEGDFLDLGGIDACADSLCGRVFGFVSPANSLISSMCDKLTAALAEPFNSVKNMIPSDLTSQISDTLSSIPNPIPDSFKDSLASSLDSIRDSLPSGFIDSLQSSISRLAENIPQQVVNSAASMVTDLPTRVSQSAFSGNVLDAVDNIAASAGDELKNQANNLVSRMSQDLSSEVKEQVQKALSRATSQLPQEMGDAFSSAASQVTDAIPKDLQASVTDAISSIPIPSGSSLTPSSISNIVDGACQGAFLGALDGVVNSVGNLGDKLSGLAGNVASTLCGASSSMIRGMGRFAETPLQFQGATGSGLGEGFNPGNFSENQMDMFNQPPDISDIPQSAIKDTFKDVADTYEIIGENSKSDMLDETRGGANSIIDDFKDGVGDDLSDRIKDGMKRVDPTLPDDYLDSVDSAVKKSVDDHYNNDDIVGSLNPELGEMGDLLDDIIQDCTNSLNQGGEAGADLASLFPTDEKPGVMTPSTTLDVWRCDGI